MPLLYTRVAPDLLYYGQQYVINSTANKAKIPIPPEIPVTIFGYDNRSFIRLLFDENWPINFHSYRYLYRNETCENTASEALRRRMRIYGEINNLYVCDNDSTSVCNINLFNLQPDDLTMLDLLLTYRTDSTAFINISSIVYSNLNTVLSKLIHIYLNFKINNNYSDFDNAIPLSSSIQVLENFYESYLVDTIFKYISSLGS